MKAYAVFDILKEMSEQRNAKQKASELAKDWLLGYFGGWDKDLTAREVALMLQDLFYNGPMSSTERLFGDESEKLTPQEAIQRIQQIINRASS